MSITIPQEVIKERLRTKLLSSEIQTNLTLDQLDSLFKAQQRTGRLVIHYARGGKSMIFFEAVENLG